MVTSIDSIHPYYRHPSDSPGMTLTNIVLIEKNYTQWSRSIELALSAKFKLGFIDSSYVKPVYGSSLLVHWNRCNQWLFRGY